MKTKYKIYRPLFSQASNEINPKTFVFRNKCSKALGQLIVLQAKPALTKACANLAIMCLSSLGSAALLTDFISNNADKANILYRATNLFIQFTCMTSFSALAFIAITLAIFKRKSSSSTERVLAKYRKVITQALLSGGLNTQPPTASSLEMLALAERVDADMQQDDTSLNEHEISLIKAALRQAIA